MRPRERLSPSLPVLADLLVLVSVSRLSQVTLRSVVVFCYVNSVKLALGQRSAEERLNGNPVPKINKS